MIGQKFGKLTVIKEVEPYISPCGAKAKKYLCKCDCGKEVFVTKSHLKSGHTKSCGCFAKEISIENGKQIKHGLTYTKRGKVSRLYRIWSCMKTRCFNENDEHFQDYGARGITICDEWKNDFQSFYDWSMSNGYADNLTIDRINVDGNYCPENCRLATNKEQNSNKRNTLFVTFEGITKTLSEWSNETGIKYQTLVYRYHSGKTPDEILKK